ncbi:MAG TPA: sigma-70 family RNA polymerase sigma factor [Solirubrobacteraceae bacterium]|jgi:RNA polymerase sigma-70 factor (ECF subfamily)
MSGAAADAASFAAMYTETNADVLAFLLRRCPTPEDAADCLAETYLVAWEKRKHVPDGVEARLWLFGVARNVMRRGHERHRRVAAAAQSLAEELQSAASARPALAPDESESITAALSELPAVDQEIITMISWDGLTPRQIGHVLGISPNVVRVRAHRARARLRSLLSTTGAELAPGHNSASGRPESDSRSDTSAQSRDLLSPSRGSVGNQVT